MVVAIISALVGLLAVGIQGARRGANRGAIKTLMNQLVMSVERYKAEHGEAPPDFAGVLHPDLVVRAAARQEVIRHLRKAFPRYVPVGDRANPANTPDEWSRFVFDISNVNSFVNDPTASPPVIRNYPGLNPANFDAATALVFWLGGLPEQLPTGSDETWQPAGFHTDSSFPFRTGGPRTEPFYGFPPLSTAEYGQQQLYFRPVRPRYLSETSAQPFVYFKARRLVGSGRFEYGFPDSAGNFTPTSFPRPATYNTGSPDPTVAWPAGVQIAVPYLEGSPPAPATDHYVLNIAALPAPRNRNLRRWREPEKFQILYPGLDGEYGYGGLLRYTGSLINFTDADYDTLASFASGQLEDEDKK
jgi:hypothetical protein